jgi:hypothetical protein
MNADIQLTANYFNELNQGVQTEGEGSVRFTSSIW